MSTATIVTDKMLFTKKVRSSTNIACCLQCRWLRLTVNLVSVALIVSANGCMQGAQGSNFKPH